MRRYSRPNERAGFKGQALSGACSMNSISLDLDWTGDSRVARADPAEHYGPHVPKGALYKTSVHPPRTERDCKTEPETSSTFYPKRLSNSG